MTSLTAPGPAFIAIHELPDPRVDAVRAMTDTVALTAERGLHEAGIGIPFPRSVVTFTADRDRKA